jgi:predicted nucleic acid-binding protein
MITHVFDTTAILAHYFHQPGAEQVNDLLTDNSVEVGLPATELLELRSQLARTLPDSAVARRAFHLYADELITTIPITRAIVTRAEGLLEKTDGAIDQREAILAATAHEENAILVHRNPRLGCLPAALLQQCALPLES